MEGIFLRWWDIPRNDIMLDKLRDSWDLVLASWDVLTKDKELLALPALSSLACGAILISFWWSTPELKRLSPGEGIPWTLLGIGFIFYFLMSFVAVFFNAALVWAAEERFSGGDPTLATALQAAYEKLGMIVAYAAIVASVGLLIRAVEEKFEGVAGRMLSSVMGLAWSAAIFLAIPVLVHRNVGPIEAIKISASMLRKTWGQQLAGVFGLGLAFTAAFLVLAIFAFLFITMGFGVSRMIGWTVVSFFLFLLSGLTVLEMALTGIYQAALYRYAQTGEVPDAFDQDQLEVAFYKRGSDWKFDR